MVSGQPRLRKTKKVAEWKNRIESTGVMAASQFISHPDNWRTHGSQQEEALVAILNNVGWVQDVIVSKRSGYLLDGHLRVLAAMAKGDDTLVPYKIVDVSEHEEALLLSVLDPVSALAGTDQAKYDELVGLLPDSLREVASLAWGELPEETEVSFTAKAHHRVLVDCADEAAAFRLHAKLTEEGYKCQMKG